MLKVIFFYQERYGYLYNPTKNKNKNKKQNNK